MKTLDHEEGGLAFIVDDESRDEVRDALKTLFPGIRISFYRAKAFRVSVSPQGEVHCTHVDHTTDPKGWFEKQRPQAHIVDLRTPKEYTLEVTELRTLKAHSEEDAVRQTQAAFPDANVQVVS